MGYVSWKYYKPNPKEKTKISVRKVMHIFAPMLVLVALTQVLFTHLIIGLVKDILKLGCGWGTKRLCHHILYVGTLFIGDF